MDTEEDLKEKDNAAIAKEEKSEALPAKPEENEPNTSEIESELISVNIIAASTESLSKEGSNFSPEDAPTSNVLVGFAQRLISDDGLLCNNKCGFYGNPRWGGLCSQCFQKFGLEGEYEESEMLSRIIQEEMKESDLRKKANESSVDLANHLVTAANSKRVTSFFERIGESLFSKEGEKQNKLDFKTIMKHPNVQDIVLRVKSFLGWFISKDEFTPVEQSEVVQEFLNEIAQRIGKHSHWKTATKAHLDFVIEEMEKYICTKIYKVVFASNNKEEEMKESILREQILRLQWVSVEMLTDQKFSESRENISWHEAARVEMAKMTEKKAPQDKLDCIVNCCKALFHTFDKAAGADEFLPILIYCVISSRPPRLYASLQYISRYCNPSRLISGEGGYFFTNLCCAVSFIETMDHTHLGISAEEFARRVELETICQQTQTLGSLNESIVSSARENVQDLYFEMLQIRKYQTVMSLQLRAFEKDIYCTFDQNYFFRQSGPDYHTIKDLNVADKESVLKYYTEYLDPTASLQSSLRKASIKSDDGNQGTNTEEQQGNNDIAKDDSTTKDSNNDNDNSNDNDEIPGDHKDVPSGTSADELNVIAEDAPISPILRSVSTNSLKAKITSMFSPKTSRHRKNLSASAVTSPLRTTQSCDETQHIIRKSSSDRNFGFLSRTFSFSEKTNKSHDTAIDSLATGQTTTRPSSYGGTKRRLNSVNDDSSTETLQDQSGLLSYSENEEDDVGENDAAAADDDCKSKDDSELVAEKETGSSEANDQINGGGDGHDETTNDTKTDKKCIQQ